MAYNLTVARSATTSARLLSPHLPRRQAVRALATSSTLAARQSDLPRIQDWPLDPRSLEAVMKPPLMFFLAEPTKSSGGTCASNMQGSRANERKQVRRVSNRRRSTLFTRSSWPLSRVGSVTAGGHSIPPGRYAIDATLEGRLRGVRVLEKPPSRGMACASWHPQCEVIHAIVT